MGVSRKSPALDAQSGRAEAAADRPALDKASKSTKKPTKAGRRTTKMSVDRFHTLVEWLGVASRDAFLSPVWEPFSR